MAGNHLLLLLHIWLNPALAAYSNQASQSHFFCCAGIEVKFIQTKHTAVERPPTKSELAEAAAVTKGTKAKGKADVPGMSPVR